MRIIPLTALMIASLLPCVAQQPVAAKLTAEEATALAAADQERNDASKALTAALVKFDKLKIAAEKKYFPKKPTSDTIFTFTSDFTVLVETEYSVTYYYQSAPPTSHTTICSPCCCGTFNIVCGCSGVSCAC